jgi:hypothetical protein
MDLFDDLPPLFDISETWDLFGPDPVPLSIPAVVDLSRTHRTIQVPSLHLDHLRSCSIPLLPGCIVGPLENDHYSIHVPRRITAKSLTRSLPGAWEAALDIIFKLHSIPDAVAAWVDPKKIYFIDGVIHVHPQAIEFSTDPDCMCRLSRIAALFASVSVENGQREAEQAHLVRTALYKKTVEARAAALAEVIDGERGRKRKN